jgi:putative transposase
MPSRVTENLHKFRTSAPGSLYFVTCCTAERHVGLADAGLRSLLHQVFTGFARSGDADTIAATVMPEHIHWLFELGARLSLGRVLARFKAETRAELSERELVWQRDFFEHRLRPAEGIEDYGLYIFLNPYRAALLDSTETWAGWYCPKPGCFNFTGLLQTNGTPPPEWIGLPVPGTLASASEGRSKTAPLQRRAGRDSTQPAPPRVPVQLSPGS